MKRMVTMGTAFLVGLAIAGTALAELESKYATGSTSAAVTFGPKKTAGCILKSLFAVSDKLSSVVKVYARPASLSKFLVSITLSNGATHIPITNTGSAIGNSATVVYWHANGTCDLRATAGSGNSATNITLSSGISAAGASGDYVYLITQQGSMQVGFWGTGAGTNDVLSLQGEVFGTGADSPLYLVLDGTSACTINATVDR